MDDGRGRAAGRDEPFLARHGRKRAALGLRRRGARARCRRRAHARCSGPGVDMLELIFWASLVAIVYTYAGYPLMLGALARLRPPTPAYPPSTPFVTLLIAAYNEQETIA